MELYKKMQQKDKLNKAIFDNLYNSKIVFVFSEIST